MDPHFANFTALHDGGCAVGGRAVPVEVPGPRMLRARKYRVLEKTCGMRARSLKSGESGRQEAGRKDRL